MKYNKHMFPAIPYAIYSLARWCFLSMLPIIVTQKFSAGGPLVASLTFKILPRVLFAPLIAKMILKRGAKDVAASAILCCAPIYILLFYIEPPVLFQSMVLLSGILEAIITTAMLVLRSQIAAMGENITTNAVFTTIERSSAVIGPALAGILLWKLSTLHSSYLMAAASLIAGILLFLSPYVKKTSLAPSISYKSFFNLFKETPILWTLWIPGLGYAFLLGALPLFLYWANTEIFQEAQNRWTVLLTFHCLGAVLGGITASKILSFVQRKISLIKVYPWLVLLRILSFFSLIAVHRWGSALVVLAVAGLPEMLEVICFFTLLQRYLPAHQEELFYALSMPIFYMCILLGTLLGGAYTQHLISLHAFWLLISILCLILAIPFLVPKKAIKGT